MKEKEFEEFKELQKFKNGNPFWALTAAFRTPELLNSLNSSLLYDHPTP